MPGFRAQPGDGITPTYLSIAHSMTKSFPDGLKMPGSWQEFSALIFDSAVIAKGLRQYVGPVYEGHDQRVEGTYTDPDGNDLDLSKITPNEEVAILSVVFLKTYIGPDVDFISADKVHIARTFRSFCMTLLLQVYRQIHMVPNKMRTNKSEKIEQKQRQSTTRKPIERVQWDMEDLSE